MKKIENCIALITGADGGIGTALIDELIKRKAAKIYATGISIQRLNDLAAKYSGIIVPVELDVTKEDSIKSAVTECNDINLLINNAGIELKSDFIGADVTKKALFEIQVNYIGVISMVNNFLPILKTNPHSFIVNILSVGSTALIKRLATYCASKAAVHLFTQSIREDLKPWNVDVIAVYPGYVDTSMSSDVNFEKITTESLSQNICEAFEEGLLDIFPDKMSSAFYGKKPILITYLK